MTSESQAIPLAVDLDGSLIETDLLIETAFEYLADSPRGILNLFVWLSHGRARLKQELARLSQLDIALLPYNKSVQCYIAEARKNGRQIYLVSASDRLLVERIARHLEFDGWFASDGVTNLSGPRKLARLTKEFGQKSFDYIGNESNDLPVWMGARRALLVGGSSGAARRLKRSGIEHDVLSTKAGSLKAWFRLLRPHQWAKNALVFVPLLTSHLFNQTAFLQSITAFGAFCLCASGVYVLNDLVDIQADRKHPTKRERPFANGDVPILGGVVLGPILMALAFALGLALSGLFELVLGVYLAITVSYSFFLKRKVLLDVVALALLYTARIIAGAVAIDVTISQWLLGFSVFLFLSLALVKRYSEIVLRLDLGLPDAHNRGYRSDDIPVLSALAAAAGFNAVVVFSLYLSSDAVRSLYRRPDVLWLVCPLFIYWISRMLLLSHRRQLDDDPVVFALRDRTSLLTLGSIAVLAMLAI
jgi:4-hydroxybenzoate polyprenyltransferase